MTMRFREKVRVGTDPQGNAIHKWATGNSHQEVLRATAKILLEYGLVEGQQMKECPVSPYLRDYIEEWFRLYKEPKLRHTTKSSYLNLIKKHIVPYFRNIRVEEINTTVLQTFYNEHNDMAQSTVRQMRAILHQVFDLAVEDGFLQRNPTESKRVFIKARKEKRREVLSGRELLDIMNSLPRLREEDQALMGLLLFTGMRRGEVLGLRWEHIDWLRKVIYVQQSVTFRDNRPVVGETKSQAGNRVVPLHSGLECILRPQRQLGGFVIGGSAPISEMSFKRTWERIGKTIDLRGATPHVFRHTYITMAASSGIDVKTLQAIAGHSDIRMTMDRYAHVLEDKVIAASAQIEQSFTAR